MSLSYWRDGLFAMGATLRTIIEHRKLGESMSEVVKKIVFPWSK